MFFILHIFLGLIFGFIPILPMTALFHGAMLKKDKRKNLKTAIPHMIGANIFCLALLSILSATGVPSIYDMNVNIIISLIPFTDISTNYLQYLQNILLFIPFGFLLPMLWKKFEKGQLTFIYGFLFSLFIEIIQIFNHRITDINDLLMNTAGTIAGYFLFMWIKRKFPKISVFSINSTNHWKWELCFCFVFAMLSVFFIQRVIASWLLGPPIIR